MAEQKILEQAKDVFSTLCRTLDKLEWRYKKDEEKLSIDCGAQGDDLPIDITIKVYAEKMQILLISHMPFVVKEDKRIDVAVAVCAVNNALVNGCFDYDITSGHMFFRMSNCFIESTIGEDLISYILFCSCQTIDLYNDKFLMLAKGMTSVKQFLSTLNNN